jgi:hypothetical protein
MRSTESVDIYFDKQYSCLWPVVYDQFVGTYYSYMYEYYPFSLHNGITIANVLILLSSPVDNFDLPWNYYYYYINCLLYIFFCFYILMLTL